MDPPSVERRLAAILSADVAGYSRLIAEDEGATVRTLAAYRDEIGLLVQQHRGRVADFTGDNFLAEFPTALDAVQGAVEIQRVIQVRNADLPDDRRMEFRIGVHLGDVSVEGGRLYGGGVNIAARLEGLAEPGGICISAAVCDQVRQKLHFAYEDLGEQALKNIAGPVRVYRVRQEAGQASPVADLPGMDDLTIPGFSGRPAIAVLAFDNLSGDPDQEYFADGIAEDLIMRLSADRHLPVIARNSSFVYKGKAVDLRQVSRELGARYLVEGSVRKAGDRIRISAQLIDATTGAHLWADRFDRQLQDVFDLQDEIVQAIIGSMGYEVHYSEMKRAVRKPSNDLNAWECMQRGTWHFNKLTKEDIATARSLYERARELDPLFVWPNQAIAMTHYLDILNVWTESPGRSTADLVRHAKRCVELDDADAFGQLALGVAYSLTGDRDKMIDALELAVRLNPSMSLTYLFLGTWGAMAGRADEAIQSLLKGMRLSPQDPYMYQYLSAMGMANFAARRYEEAVDWTQRSIGARRDYFVPYTHLAASLAHLGRIDEGRSVFEELIRLQPGISTAGIKLIHSSADPDFVERYVDGLRKAGLKE